MNKITLIILLSFYSVYSQKTDSLIGLPFKSFSSDSLVKKRVLSQITDLEKFRFDMEEFKRKKKHKVLAVNYDLITDMNGQPYYYLNTYGYVWGYSSIEEAKKIAAEECKKPPTYRPGTILYLIVDDDLNIPEELFSNFKKMEHDIAEDHARIFLLADKTVPLNQASDLTISIADVQSGFLGNSGDKVKLNPTFPIKIGYPDGQKDYASACQDRIFYALQNVSSIDSSYYKKILLRLSSKGLYGTYRRSVNTVMNYKIPVHKRQMENIAKFSSHIRLNDSNEKVLLPNNLKAALKNEIIKEIWTEGSVRITEEGTPIEKDSIVKPLAILTDKKLYVAVEIRMPDTKSYCSISEDFHNKVIDISAYKDNEQGRLKIYFELMKNLEKEFSNKPFSAEKIKKLYPPGEMWMIRDGLPSVMLGPPYYERTTYMFKVYSKGDGEDDLVSLYNKQIFKGVGKSKFSSPKVFFYLEVTDISTIKAHKNEDIYSEISKDDQAKYNRAINAAIDSALQKTCTALKGKIEISICNLK